MNTCTLRKLGSGEIVATVDERPKEGEFGYNVKMGKHFIYTIYMLLFVNWEDHKIIASNIEGVGKELVVDYGLGELKYTVPINEVQIYDAKFNKPYEYTENENQIIIKL